MKATLLYHPSPSLILSPPHRYQTIIFTISAIVVILRCDTFAQRNQ